jgi:hypothetical protein
MLSLTMGSSIFPSPVGDGDDLKSRLTVLEEAQQALARDHEALRAETEENVALLTLLGVEEWLRDAYKRAKASGWLVTCSPKAIVFTRPEGEEHTRRVPIPLPGAREVEQLRNDLHARIICFETQSGD